MSRAALSPILGLRSFFASAQNPQFFRVHGRRLQGDNRVEEAGEMLCRFVDPRGLLDSAKGPRQPLVIFAFDDAHVLTDNPITDSWNLFSELRHNLRRIYKLPIFRFLFRKRESSIILSNFKDQFRRPGVLCPRNYCHIFTSGTNRLDVSPRSPVVCPPRLSL